MTHTGIIKEAKTAFISAITAAGNEFPSVFAALQVIREMDNITTIHSRRILVGGKATPEIVGAKVIGWEVDLVIQAVSHFKKWTEAQHEEVCNPIEAFILLSDLAARMTNATFKVQVATPGVIANDFDDDERITEFHVILDCFLTGV